jgi:hypothetical protein
MFNDNGAGIREDLQQQLNTFIVKQGYLPTIFCVVIAPGEDSYPIERADVQLLQSQGMFKDVPPSDNEQGWRVVVYVKPWRYAETPTRRGIVLEFDYLETPDGDIPIHKPLRPEEIRIKDMPGLRLVIQLFWNHKVEVEAETYRAIKANLAEHGIK